MRRLRDRSSGCWAQPFFVFFNRRPKLVNLVGRQRKVLDEIVGDLARVAREVIEPRADGVLVQFRESARRTNAVFLDKQLTELLDLPLAEPTTIHWCSFCFREILVAMKTFVHLSSRGVLASFDDVFSFLSTIKLTVLILADNFDYSSGASHTQSPQQEEI